MRNTTNGKIKIGTEELSNVNSSNIKQVKVDGSSVKYTTDNITWKEVGSGVSKINYDSNSKPLEGLSIDGVNYRLLPLGISAYNTTVAIGEQSGAYGSNSVAMGYFALAGQTASNSIALGAGSTVVVPNWFLLDGTNKDQQRTIALKSTDNIFFRNELVDVNKKTQASYVNGKTLTQVIAELQAQIDALKAKLP